MNLSMTASRAALKLRKHSPHILFGAGVVGMVGTVVLSSRATLRAQAVRHSHHQELKRADEMLVDRSNTFTEDAYKHKVVSIWTSSGVEYAKLYAPTVILGVASIACLTKSHQILTSRNSVLMAAYSGLDAAFKRYRSRVVEELGEEKDTQFAHGSVDKTITGYDEKGNGKAKSIKTAPEDASTLYGRWFDETNRHWDKDHGYNHTFLENQMKWANLELKRKGHMFLNEVYDLLGMERSKEGQMAGWVYNRKDGEGDGYIDFGFNRYPEFVAGFERSVFLDFNVDGMILDHI
jgi:hypothetical protein